MNKQCILLLIIFSLTIAGVQAQKTDNRVLFTVEDKSITVDEFTYIYSKTNGDQANFSEPSLQEYLDLYVKFKLKVQRAKDMGLDTVRVLQEELAGYRKQLSDSYLIDRAIGDRLINEAYEHSTEDVDISHVLVAVKANASPEDTLVAYQKIMAAYQQITKGANFEDVAQEVSDDSYSKTKGGHIGYTTALYPAGLHNLEYAAYTVPMGKMTSPIRTKAGYHLLMVHDRRPARGEIEVAHILVRKNEANPVAAKTRIDSIYQALKAGTPFKQLALNVSDDKRTAQNNGYLGFFGISQYERAFEDASFSLKTDDEYTAPIETSLGWHIIKRVSRKEIQPFSIEKPRLEGKVRKDARFEDAKKELLNSIRTKNNFKEQTTVLNTFVTSLPDTFTTFRWKAPVPSSDVLFTLDGGFITTLGDFTDYLGKATRTRVTYARDGNAESVARKLYEEFIDYQLLKYEESMLEERYPEFKSLMREYEEGIALFEATKIEVWDKAGQDTVGLEAFFEGVQGKYRWEPRAVTTVYRIGISYKDEAADIHAYAENHTAEEVEAKFNEEGSIKVLSEDATYEQFKSIELKGIAWKVGALSELSENKRSRSLMFLKIEDILPTTNKTLGDARGYVIADYQDQLERQWVEELRKNYKVNIDQKVFNSLVK